MFGTTFVMVRRLHGLESVDCGATLRNNHGMEIPGTIQNGVVVFDETQSLPEGAKVRVLVGSRPVIRIAKNQRNVEFPLVRSSAPGSVQLTNEMIGQILDDEDATR